MRIAILGVGALGGLLGFHLSGGAGDEVWLIDRWDAHVAAMQAHGLAYERDERVEVRPVHAAADPSVVGPCDVVVVLVKSPYTAEAATQATALLKPATLVVTLQNGLGNYEVLVERLGAERVMQGVTSLGATLLGPGRVRHAGMGPTYLAAGHVAEPFAGLAVGLVERLRHAGLPAGMSDNLETLVWNKLLVNVAINALTALLRVPNGAVATLPEARRLAGWLVEEAVAVAAARGIHLEGNPLSRALAVAEATAGNRSSMLQDVVRGVPTEIEAINGAIVREGERLGVPTPYNRIVTELVRALTVSKEMHEGTPRAYDLPSG